MSIETEITRIKTNISNAYTKAEEKGATLPEVKNSSNLPATIESITGGDEWQPEPDWWDIDKILEEDTEDYAGKIIALIGDEVDTTIIYRRNSSKIVTSDGVTYENTQTTYNHTWNKSQDKECNLGYKTRYIIWYYNDNNVNISPTYSNENPLYIIFKNMNINCYTNGNNHVFCDLKYTEAIKGINSKIITTNITINN